MRNARRVKYPPVTQSALNKLIKYGSDYWAFLSGRRESPPDAEHLLVEITHGPISSAWLQADPETGRPAVAIKLRNEDLGARYLSYPQALAVRLMLAMGGGLSINDASKRIDGLPAHGFGYLALFGGNYKLSAMRVFADAQPGQIAKQHAVNGERIDYHSLDPAFITKVGTAIALEQAPSRLGVPHRGREYAMSVAAEYYRRNAGPVGITTSLDDFLTAIWGAFALCDALKR